MSWGPGYPRYLNYKVIIPTVTVTSCTTGCYSTHTAVDEPNESQFAMGTFFCSP